MKIYGIILAFLVTMLIASPVLAQGKGKGIKQHKKQTQDRGRDAGELPLGLDRYQDEHGGKLPAGLQKQLGEKDHLPSGLTEGGKKESFTGKATK